MLGEAAGIAATMATNGDLPIQSISVPLLQQKLLSREIPIKLPNADSMDNEKRHENTETFQQHTNKKRRYYETAFRYNNFSHSHYVADPDNQGRWSASYSGLLGRHTRCG